MPRAFRQVDVFAASALSGNPVAVVLDGQGLSTAQMQQFARWMNLSETTFVLPATNPAANYRVRIFTPSQELPFAGHPTLGTCHAWLETSGYGSDEVVQQCGAGLVRVRRVEGQLAFAAPRLLRSGPVAAEDLQRVAEALRISVDEVLDAQWVDNGPGWVAVVLADVEHLLAIEPGPLGAYFVGAVAVHAPDGPADVEVRAFFTVDGATVEDPVTGSLNASVAPWLVNSGWLRFPYTARQGTAIGRHGLVRVSQDEDGVVWVGGATVSRVSGTVAI